MIVILPVRETVRVVPVLALMGLLFCAGCFLGFTGVWVFTASALLEKIHLLAIPVAVITGVVLLGLVRQAFRTGDGEATGFFATPGKSAAVMLVFALLSIAGGAWLGVFAAVDERSFLLTQAENRRHAELRAQAPLVAARGARAPSGQFRLQGIFYNATRPSAIVNGQTVITGDEINGWRVRRIEPTKVTMAQAEGQSQTLELK